MDSAAENARPLLRVVRGAPDDAELAALTAVLASVAGGTAGDTKQARRSHWADRAMLLRGAMHPGPGAWRAAGYPR